MKQRTDVEGASLVNETSSRRQFLKGAAAAGGAAILGAPYIRNAEAAKTTT